MPATPQACLRRRDVLAWPALLLPAAGRAASVPASDELVFGLITPREPKHIVAAWSPFLQRVGTEVGRTIKAWAVSSPAELVDGFKHARVDLAWVGNAPALDIAESGAGEVFAQMVTADGSTGYESILVTHKDSALRSLDDVQRPGRQLVFGDGEAQSTSGHLVPLYYAFVRRGINEPAQLFKQIRSGSHRVNLTRAANREVDVATANNVELDLFRAEHPGLAARLRVVWKSPTIPQSPLMWSMRLPVALRRSIQQAIVSFGRRGSAEEAQLLRGVNDLSGFRRSSNAQLITVCDITMFAAWQQVNNDRTLSPQQKTERIAAISQRAARLELRLKLASGVL